MGTQEAFGRRARACRCRKGLKLIELSARTGLHRNYLSDLEHGRRNPSLEVITRLAKGLEVDAGELVGTPEKDRRIRQALQGLQRTARILEHLEERMEEEAQREEVRRARQLCEQSLGELRGALGEDGTTARPSRAPGKR